MLGNQKNIRILLLGEHNPVEMVLSYWILETVGFFGIVRRAQTGKTTLVLSLVSEEFPPKVPAQAEEITIPADVTPERILTQIVDCSTRVQTQDELTAEIRRADVVCLVHALDDPKSLQQISKFWLPLIRHASADPQESTPVVIVGNKLDLISTSQLDNVLPIMSEFSEVETCIECSAKTLLNLSETFWFAQKAVLYPTAPLYNAERRELTPDCICALTRIFRICDNDNDGYLSDRELEAFQSRCFSVPLTAQSLQDVKQLIRQSCPGGVTLSGVTQKGFLFLHLIFIQKGRHETTWTVLRQFGYDNQIRLSTEFLSPKLVVPPGCSTEISPLGFNFLQTLFTKYDLDRDGCLSPAELAELLATCPSNGHHQLNTASLADRVATNSQGWITRQGFLAHWILSAYLEPSQALEYLAYLGFTYFAADTFWSNATSSTNGDASGDLSRSGDRFNYDQSAATIRRRVTRSESGLREARGVLLRGILVTPEKRVDAIRRSTNRTVFYCRVYGARKVGKTCLLQGLLGRHIHGSAGLAIGGISGRRSDLAAAYGLPVYGQLRSLLLHEVDTETGESMTASEALSADVACLVYDVSDPESFRYVANLFLTYYRGTRVPCLFVANKSDQPHNLQNYPVEPEELTVKYNLTPPMYFSSIHLGQTMEDAERSSQAGSSQQQQQQRDSRSDVVVVDPAGVRRRAGSLEPLSGQHLSTAVVRDCLASGVGEKADRGLTSINSEQRPVVSHEESDVLPRSLRRSSQPSEVNGKPAGHHESAYFAPVYIQLATLANYPHLRGLQLATTDQAWKWTLAATVLAGFGFVAFRIVRTHF